jgi:hypothetical protein
MKTSCGGSSRCCREEDEEKKELKVKENHSVVCSILLLLGRYFSYCFLCVFVWHLRRGAIISIKMEMGGKKQGRRRKKDK